MCEEDFEKVVTFFADKLRAKAFPVRTVVAIINKYAWHKPQEVFKKRAAEPLTILPFVMQFCTGAEQLGVSEILHRHDFLLPTDFLSLVKLVTSFTTFFRERYYRFL